jgi:hypothetical protein
MQQIWLDDIHHPRVSPFHLESPQWIANGNDFIDIVDLMIADGTHNNIDLISFDNDLGEEYDIDGKYCFNYIESLLNDGYFKNLKTIVIHSDNSSAVNSMMAAKDIFKEKYNINIFRKRRVV